MLEQSNPNMTFYNARLADANTGAPGAILMSGNITAQIFFDGMLPISKTKTAHKRGFCGFF
ncbi:MAG: hypothetical protein Pg6C_16020 [Treponemataceae bacterium]|nr:MAG: hypothetical protein Pg6C_16020 [Treponemataceae bacterium]